MFPAWRKANRVPPWWKMGRTHGIGLTLVCRRGSSWPHTVSVPFSSKVHSSYPQKSPGRQQQTTPEVLKNASCHLFAQKKKTLVRVC